jgi:hypothetical protein
MPIVFIHGVANRDKNAFENGIKVLLERHISPLLNPTNPDQVAMIAPFWGDLGATFAYGDISRPRSAILGQGAQDATPLPALALGLRMESASDEQDELLGGQDEGAATLVIDFGGMPLEQQVLVLYQVLSPETTFPEDGALALQIEDALRSEAGQAITHNGDSADHQLRDLINLVTDEGEEALGQGPKELLAWVKKSIGSLAIQAARPLAPIINELRPGANTAVIRFMGDIFEYFHSQTVEIDGKNVPGPIMQRILTALREAQAIKVKTGEPLIVVTHSMGGQLMYDAVTYFADHDPLLQDMKVDFWAAAACQVSLFEELRLFRVSRPDAGPQHPPAHPHRVGYWWAVFDKNDWLSYTTEGIFPQAANGVTGVHDEEYDGKLIFPWSHGGYVSQDRFFRLMADRIRER